MEQDIIKKLEEQDKKLEEVYRSVEKIRKYLFWTFIVTIVVIVLPLIGMLFVLPNFINMYSGGNVGL